MQSPRITTRQPGSARSRDDLAPLLASAAAVDLNDADAGGRLRREAHVVTTRMTAAGALPRHLVVAADDPLVVVVRALAIAWRQTAPAEEAPPSVAA